MSVKLGIVPLGSIDGLIFFNHNSPIVFGFFFKIYLVHI